MPNYEITHELTINKVIIHEHREIQSLYLKGEAYDFGGFTSHVRDVTMLQLDLINTLT